LTSGTEREDYSGLDHEQYGRWLAAGWSLLLVGFLLCVAAIGIVVWLVVELAD